MIQVGIIMGSNSDWPVMQQAAQFLKEFGVEYEARVVSAHRTPDLMFEYAETARERGIKAIIAGAGGAAPGRTVRDRRFSATQRHRFLYCHRRRGAAVADGRRPLCLPQRREGEISSVGKRARARAALRHADPAEIPHRMAGRRGLLADDSDDFLFLAVTPLRRARGPLACRTGAGGRRAAGACPAIGLVTQRPA